MSPALRAAAAIAAAASLATAVLTAPHPPAVPQGMTAAELRDAGAVAAADAAVRQASPRAVLRGATGATPAAVTPRAAQDVTGVLPGPSAYRDPMTECASPAVPHPAGFALMGGTGTDAWTSPDGTRTSSNVPMRHVPVQFECTNPTLDGGLHVEVFIQPYSIDVSEYDFTVGPAGAVLDSVTPGHRGETLRVERRLGSWPQHGCDRVVLSGAGRGHADVDDTFCFTPDGSLAHVTLAERGTLPDGTTRSLQASLDLLPNG